MLFRSWGRQCAKMPVVYINFELQPWALAERLGALIMARPECKFAKQSLALWNLRGHNADLSLLRPKLEEQLAKHQFGLIILDPAYKVLGNRDENANGEIASLMNEFEALAKKTGAAIVVAHHFAKGDSSAKNAIDGDPSTWWHSRFSGEAAKPPHELVIDLGAERTIRGVVYLARQDGSWNGAIKDVEFAISSSPDKFGEPVVKAQLEKKKAPQLVECPPTKGRYLLLRATSEHGGAAFASCAELGVLGERPARAGARHRHRCGLLPAHLEELRRDGQHSGWRQRLHQVLVDGADRLAARDERPDADRALHHQPGQVRPVESLQHAVGDRKSTRLNSSHRT